MKTLKATILSVILVTILAVGVPCLLLSFANSKQPVTVDQPVTFCERDETVAYDLGHGLEYGEDYYLADAETYGRIKKNSHITFSRDPENAKGVALAFDISESGRLAVSTTNHTILVFDADGNFEYTYQFNCSGAYGVWWAGENVAIMYCRGDTAEILSDDGRVLAEYLIDLDKNPRYWDLVDAKERTVNGKTYQLGDVVTGYTHGYDSVTELSPDGSQRIVFEWKEQLPDPMRYDNFEFRLFAVTAPIFIVIIIVIYILRRKNDKKISNPGGNPLT